MKNQPKTILDTLCERLREQAQRFNPNLETAPVAVLWTDDRRDWEGVLPQIKTALPELFSLGNYLPAERTGPGAWLRMVADGQAGGLAAGQVPILYLPGVANGSLRTDLRTVKDVTEPNDVTGDCAEHVELPLVSEYLDLPRSHSCLAICKTDLRFAGGRE